jgi:type IV pilus assembly protein PilB
VTRVTRRTSKAHPAAAGEGGDSQVEFAELWRPTEGQAVCYGPAGVLLERGKITPAQLQKAIDRQKSHPHLSVLDVLIQAEATDETTALGAVAEYFKLPFLRVTTADVDVDTFERLPVQYLKAKGALPIRREESGAVLVGISDPADIFLIDDLKRRLQNKLALVVVSPTDVNHVIDELSTGPGQQVEDIIKDIAEDSVEVVESKDEDVADLEKVAGESPVIRYVNYLVSSAVRDNASDIHIEPGEKRLRVRCRIDGVLFEQQAPPRAMHAAIVSRLKIMANLDISERRLPQDGRIRATVQGRTVDLRVSTLPVIHGEKCVIRILDNRAITVGLEKLGMGPDTLEGFSRQIYQPHGIVLVTGPTGSGKTTTLYSALRAMDSEKQNISTVEDPVEYELAQVNQVNVQGQVGMTFSAALRSLLRQDPDIVMLGEIRDEETARIAVQASLTGHLVLSTLHTNDAPASITRLINIGIEPYLISAAVNGVLAQRLVRKICENCKTPMTEVKESIVAYLEKNNVDNRRLYRGVGCEKCRQTGYKGRLGCFELLELNDELRDVISRDPSLGELRRAARESGMQGLRSDGLQKVADGLTTVEELMRVTET